LKLLAFADIHGSIEAAEKIASLASSIDANAILIAGDIAINDLNLAGKILLKIANSNKPVFFVPGNMDSHSLIFFNSDKVKCVHGSCEELYAFSIVGVGGATSIFSTPFELTEREIELKLNEAFKAYKRGSIILLSHAPPKNTKLDKVGVNLHVGSTAIRKFIENKKPVLTISGHIHEAKGLDKIGKSLIINPGPAFQGYYAIIEINSEIKANFLSI
jgi:Icc-related predicted phosphoesterase